MTHPLLQGAVLMRCNAARIRGVHRIFAEVLTVMNDPVRAAWHLAEAAFGADEAAAAALEESGQLAAHGAVTPPRRCCWRRLRCSAPPLPSAQSA